MFSIVSMQEVLINLNGGDDLFRLFEGPRSKGRRVSKSFKDKPPLFTVREVWILPSHIIILTLDLQKLIAYDQLPRLHPNTKEETDLLSVIEDCGGGVLDLIYILRQQEYVLVLMRTGDILVWSFIKPQHEWKYVTKISLSKHRNAQVLSYVFNEEEGIIVWCEKRGTTFCYIFSAYITISDNDVIAVSDARTLLHNSLPMNIFLVPDGCCFMPVANKPPGLLMFSCYHSDTVSVHIWNDDFDKRVIPTTLSDFQAIITTSISLWINSSANENKFIAVASHPSTRQLIVLQNDLQVYVVGAISKDGCREVVRMCTLEVSVEHDVFAKDVIKIFPFQRTLMVVMSDGLINVFEVVGGLFLWKTDTFRNNSPKVWIRRGSLPTIGMWNRSGIWNLRPMPISEQIRSLQQDDVTKQNEMPKPTLSDVELSADAITCPTTKQSKKQRRIKQGVNRSTEIPTHHIFKILAQWQLCNLSSDIAINVATHLKEVLHDENSEEEIDMDEMVSVLDEINDPVLLLVLFADKVLPYTIRKRLLDKLTSILELDSSKYIDADVFAILEQYSNLGLKIEKCYNGESIATLVEHGSITLVKEELRNLRKYMNTNHNVATVEQTLNHLFALDSKFFTAFLLTSVLNHDLSDTYFHCEDQFCDEFRRLFWKVLLRYECVLLDSVVIEVWTHAPRLLKLFVQEADVALSSAWIGEVVTFTSIYQVIRRILSMIWVPGTGRTSPSTSAATVTGDEDKQERARLYCYILEESNRDHRDEEAYEILLENNLVDDAMKILRKYAGNTQLHYSLFFKMMEFLIGSKMMDKYANELKDLIPYQFNIAEVYKVFLTSNTNSGSAGGQIFCTSGNDLTIAMLKPLMEVMLQE